MSEKGRKDHIDILQTDMTADKEKKKNQILKKFKNFFFQKSKFLNFFQNSYMSKMMNFLYFLMGENEFERY